jgi:hypothetical protein
MSNHSTADCGILSCLCLQHLRCTSSDSLSQEEKYKILLDKELLKIVGGYKLADLKFIRNENDIPYCMYCLKLIDNQKQTLIECDQCHYYVGHYDCFRKWREGGNRMCKACGTVLFQ